MVLCRPRAFYLVQFRSLDRPRVWLFQSGPSVYSGPHDMDLSLNLFFNIYIVTCLWIVSLTMIQCISVCEIFAKSNFIPSK